MAERATYPQSTIAKLLDLTERRVRQLTAEGVIPRADRGQYELVPAVQGYIRFLRERAIKGDAVTSAELGASRAALLKARARMATLEADQFEATLLSRPDVERAWAAILANCRARLLTVPSKTAQAIVYLETPTQISSLLTTAISEALDELTTLPVYVDRDQGAHRQSGDGGADGAEDDEAAADMDGVELGGRERRVLSPESSAEPGKWSTARQPYQRQIMDAMGDPTVPLVVLMTSSQVGEDRDDDQPVRVSHRPRSRSNPRAAAHARDGESVVDGSTDADAPRQPDVQRRGRRGANKG